MQTQTPAGFESSASTDAQTETLYAKRNGAMVPIGEWTHEPATDGGILAELEEMSAGHRSRVETSIEVLGHPDEDDRPVEAGEHYDPREFKEVDGIQIPMMVLWESGALDIFSDAERSLANREAVLEDEHATDGDTIVDDNGDRVPARSETANFGGGEGGVDEL